MLTKPKYREGCNGCGYCCVTELCDLAEDAFPGASAPCPALEWEDGRAWCGMVRHPSRHLQLNFTGADSVVSELYAKGIAVGQGCGMPDEDAAIGEVVSGEYETTGKIAVVGGCATGAADGTLAEREYKRGLLDAAAIAEKIPHYMAQCVASEIRAKHRRAGVLNDQAGE